MENIAHTFFGTALGQTGLKKITGLGMATLIISANLPDIDLLWSFYSQTSYLFHHRGFTHSFLGLIPQMFILSTIMYFGGKWLKSRNPGFQDVDFRKLLLLSFLGLLSHLGLDYLNDYGLRPFLPVSENIFFSGTIFIVDAWFWLLLGGYTFLTVSLNRLLIILFTLFALASSFLILFFPELPTVSRLIYISGIVLLIAARLKFGQIENRKLGVITFSLFFIYNFAVAQLKQAAELRFSGSKSVIIFDQVEKYLISPEALNPFKWHFLAANNRFIYRGTINALKPEWELIETIPTNFTDPFVKKALKTETGLIMKYFTNFLFAYIKKDKKWVYVYLRDARYIQAGEKGFASKIVKFPLPEVVKSER